MIPKELLTYLAGVPITSTILSLNRVHDRRTGENTMTNSEIIGCSLAWPLVWPLAIGFGLTVAPMYFVDYCFKKN